MELSEIQKKILYSGLFLLGIIAIGYLLYFVFFRTTESDIIIDENVNVTTGLPNVNDLLNINEDNINDENLNTEEPTLPGVDAIARGGLTDTDILTPGMKAQDPAISRDGNSMRFYNPDDNKFYRVDADGNITQIGDATFPDVETVTWGNTTDETILEFPDGTNIYYNLNTGRQVTLPKEAEEFDFSPTDSQIAFKYMHIDPERRVLAVSNPDGTSARTLESLGENGDRVDVRWSPTGKVAANWAEFIDLNRQELGFVGLKGENFKGTIVEGRGLRRNYSSDGQQLLYSVYSEATDNKPSLWIVDADGSNIGNNRSELQLNTFADKCAFSGDSKTIYCGVPSVQKSGFGLVPGVLGDTADDIYKIDLVTGLKTKIATPVNENGEATYQVESMVVTEEGDKLIFQDALTGEIIKIDIK